MTAPAGPCEWCGGPQWWTVASGVMYVKCQAGCVSLFPEERVNFDPPSDKRSLEGLLRIESGNGTTGGSKGVTRSGREAKETDDDLPF